MTWLDSQPSTERWLQRYRATNYIAKDYDGGDERFGVWLTLCNQRAIRLFGVGIFDVADWRWRDAFDSGESPAVAVAQAFEADDVYASFFS